jgi:hypothetical protein
MSRKIVCDMCEDFIDLHEGNLGVSGVRMNDITAFDSSMLPLGEFHWCSSCTLQIVKAVDPQSLRTKS